jgi:hypothetical protein
MSPDVSVVDEMVTSDSFPGSGAGSTPAVTVELDEAESPSDAVLAALSSARVDLTDSRPPVADVVDLDAVDSLFDRSAGRVPADLSVEFDYRDRRVVVEGTGVVRVFN